MNKKLTFSGGEPAINFDDLDRNNKANLAALTAAFRAFGDNYIIQGVTGTTPVTAGYIMLDGEILQVDAHAPSSTHFVKVVTYDANGDKTFNDATARQTWQINRATITAGSGNLAYAGAFRLSGMPLTKEVDSGDWNMVATNTITVAHGLTDFTKIRTINVMVRDDADTTYYPLMTFNGTKNHGGVESIDATNITLGRLATGVFDSTDFDSTSYNRAYLTIGYTL